MVEDPNADPAYAYHAIAAAFRYQASISPKMVDWHRYRGDHCPCGGPLPQSLVTFGDDDDEWRPGEVRMMTAAIIANPVRRVGDGPRR